MNTSLIITILTLAALNSAQAQPFTCKPGCTNYGNCNKETGKCECPWGRSGDECEIDHLPACRHTPDGPAHCGHMGMRPCKCFEQCWNYVCDGDACDFLDVANPHSTTCFHRTDLSDDEQHGKVPAKDEPNVKYYRGYAPQGTPVEIGYREAIDREWGNIVLNLEECGEQKCNGNGVCFQYVEEDGYDPECICHYGYSDPNCDLFENKCVNKCSGRGTCNDGFCHCEEGYWGVGCHRSVAYPPESATPHPIDFKIYVYNLPMEIAAEVGVSAGWTGHDPIYTAYRNFNDRIVGSSVITENPYEANLFYIPAYTYHYTSNLGVPELHLVRVLTYIKENYPFFWNRHGGKDHMLWVPGDRSSCLAESELTQAPIKMTHFGYYAHNVDYEEKKWLDDKGWGVATVTDWGCYHPLKDLVLPPTDEWDVEEWARQNHITNRKPAHQAWDERKTLLFFAGGIREEEPDYSGGARQTLWKHYQDSWKDDPTIKIGGIIPDYPAAFRDAKYCFAPYGHGFGIRTLQAIAGGCIPVIIQEHVFQWLQDVLPYEEFSIRLSNDDIERLPEILRSITKEQYEKLYDGVTRYYPAFIWQPHAGGKAFEYTILAMRRRWLNLKAKYYGLFDAHSF